MSKQEKDMRDDLPEITTVEVQPSASTSDDEEPPPEEEEQFRWRGDPEETFSDWTIEIVHKASLLPNDKDNGTLDSPPVEVYYVHKCILSYGARKSDYFARLFRNAGNANFNEAHDNTSRIELEPLAAKVFPCLLDYMYASESPLQISTQTAVALHSLGEYFEMKRLRWETKQFIKNDVTMKNADVYSEHATIFQNEIIIGMLASFLGKNIQEVAPKSSVVKKSDPELWVRALHKIPAGNDLHWSKLVSEIGKSHVETLNKQTFQGLTDANRMPRVDAGVALALCELEDELHSNGVGDDLEKKDDEFSLSSLQERCATALSLIWQELTLTGVTVKVVLERRKPNFLVLLLMKCLLQAKAALELCQNELARSKQQSKMASEQLEKSESEQAQSLVQTKNALKKCQKALKANQEKLAKAQGVIKKLKPFPKNAKLEHTNANGVNMDFDDFTEYHPNLADQMSQVYRPHNHSPSYPAFYYDISASE